MGIRLNAAGGTPGGLEESTGRNPFVTIESEQTHFHIYTFQRWP
jgi:hypothetical protein